jgi:large subunit ribosomal protein L31
MREGVHPEWYPEARVVCACGNTWTTGATQPEIRTDVCSACHPFFTGEQRIVDTAGQVERFYRRLERGQEARADVKEQRQQSRQGQEGRKKIKVVFEDEEEETTEEPVPAEE